MEWRCDWCGKPHAENDPPCDNCGHSRFEKAIVRRTDLSEGEKRAETLVWVCTDCGREHPKHAPPCSRCGNTTLEKQTQRVEESELTAPGYLDLVTPRYLAVLGVTLLVATVAVLGFAGVVDLPGFDQTGVPDVEGVPGNESTAGGVSLADVEDAYVTALNDELATADRPQLERSDDLDEVTTFYNQQVVRWQLGGGPEPDGETASELLGGVCRPGSSVTFQELTITPDGEPAEELGASLAAVVVDDPDWPSESADTIGVDVHSVDGTLYLGQFLCAGE